MQNHSFTDLLIYTKCGSVTVTAVAKVVLDHCMIENDKDKNTHDQQCNVEFNYEFLEDYCDKPISRKDRRQPSKQRDVERLDLQNLSASGAHSASSKLDNGKNQDEPARWRPLEFSPKYHPLALMVSWIE